MKRFTVVGAPIAQPRQRHSARVVNGRAIVRNYTPKSHPVTEYKQAIQLAAKSAGTLEVCQLPIEMRLSFVMPRPKAIQWKTKQMTRLAHTSKPDLDNLIKSVLDALTGVLFRDDSQVAMLEATKTVAGDERPKTVIEFRFFDPKDSV